MQKISTSNLFPVSRTQQLKNSNALSRPIVKASDVFYDLSKNKDINIVKMA